MAAHSLDSQLLLANGGVSKQWEEKRDWRAYSPVQKSQGKIREIESSETNTHVTN